MTRTTTSILLGSALVSGCVPATKSVGEGESQSGGGGGSTSGQAGGTGRDDASGGVSMTGVMPTAAGDSGVVTEAPATRGDSGEVMTSTAATETGAQCEIGDCGACPPPLSNIEYCDGDEFVCDCIFEGVCDSVEVACAYMEETGVAPEGALDCGVAELDDPDETWAALRACAEDAVEDQIAFKATFQFLTIDTVAFSTFVGLPGGVYELKEVHVSEALPPFSLGPQGSVRDCDGFVPMACVPSSGESCLSCNPSTDFSTVCAGPASE